MTDTLRRPAPRRPAGRPGDPTRAARPLVEVGVLAATWACCAGLVTVAVPVLLVWATDARAGSGAAAAMRTAGQVWLIAHGAGLDVPGGTLGLTPLGLLAVPLLLLLRAAGHSAREARVGTLRSAGLLALAIAVPYAVLAAVVAALAGTSEVHPISWQALIAGFAVGGAGGLIGALRAARLWPAVLPGLPPRLIRLVVATAGALAVVVAGGALVTAGSLVVHLSRAGTLAAASHPGPVGGLALLALGLALVPNAAIWGASWLAGPGFAVGVGTAVGPFGTTLGPVPSLPVLAALPGPVPAWLGGIGLAVPLAAGVLAGLLVAPRLERPTWLLAAGEAALVGPVAGAVAGVAGWLSGGAAGGARLTAVGPSPWRLGVAIGLEVAVAAAVAAASSVRFRP